MRKLILLSGIVTMTMMMSCKNEEPVQPVAPEPPVVVHETVINQPPPPPPPVEKRVEKRVEKNVDEDGTSISVSKDGVSLDTKKGEKSTKIGVKNGQAEIKIK